MNRFSGVVVFMMTVLVAACGGGEEIDLPETHTFERGENIVAVSARLCMNPSILDERGEGRWRRWLEPSENLELTSPNRWRTSSTSGVRITVYPGETFAVPQNLCVPTGTQTARNLFLILGFITIVFGGLAHLARRGMRAGGAGSREFASTEPRRTW